METNTAQEKLASAFRAVRSAYGWWQKGNYNYRAVTRLAEAYGEAHLASHLADNTGSATEHHAEKLKGVVQDLLRALTTTDDRDQQLACWRRKGDWAAYVARYDEAFRPSGGDVWPALPRS